MTQQEVLDRLKEGNQRFVTDKLDGKLQNSSRREHLVSGQSPYAIILSCSDSRVVPELAFDTGLGELFVIRIAGNVANQSTVASIEYAVVHLGTKVIVVLGHESCGAVSAAIAGGDNGVNLNHLLSHISQAINDSGANADVQTVVKKNAKINAQELVKKSTIIAEAIQNEGLQIVSAYYNLDSGKVDFL